MIFKKNSSLNQTDSGLLLIIMIYCFQKYEQSSEKKIENLIPLKSNELVKYFDYFEFNNIILRSFPL
jgi:hypothetical protein